MAEAHHKKQQITHALTEVRIQVQHQVSRLSRTLEMKHHFQGSIKDYPWEWASAAAMFGWLLSRVPARKKRIYIDSSSLKPMKARKAGPLGKLWRGFWNLSKPIIAAYLAKLLAEKAKRLKASD
jgi:hypothetical protein